MIKSIIYTVIILFCAIQLNAQTSEVIRSNRPGQYLSPNTVGKNILQIEAGLDYLSSAYQDMVIYRTYTPNALLRYGINEKFEINAAFGHTFTSSKYVEMNDISTALFGATLNLINGDISPMSLGLNASINLPIFSEFNSNYNNYHITLMAEKNINKLAIGANLGATYDPTLSNVIGTYCVSLSYYLTNNLNLLLENFGTFGELPFSTSLGGGLAYIINKNLQFDLYALTNLNGIGDVFLGSVGFSWRLNSK